MSVSFDPKFIKFSKSSGLSDYLVAHWKLDEASGNIVDSHGDHDGTPAGSPTYSQGGIQGTSIAFGDGNVFSISGYAEMAIGGTQDASLSWWGYVTGDVTWYMYVLGAGPGWTFFLQRTALNQYSMAYYDGSQGIYSSYFALDFNNWHHFAIVKTGANSVKFYLDADLINDNTSYTTVSKTPGSMYITFDDNYSWWEGRLDEMSLWIGKALTQDEIDTLYNSGNGISYPF